MTTKTNKKKERLGWVAVGALVLNVSRKDDVNLTLTLSPLIGTLDWSILAVTTPQANFDRAKKEESIQAVLENHAHATWKARGLHEALRQAEAYATNWQRTGQVEAPCACEEIDLDAEPDGVSRVLFQGEAR